MRRSQRGPCLREGLAVFRRFSFPAQTLSFFMRQPVAQQAREGRRIRAVLSPFPQIACGWPLEFLVHVPVLPVCQHGQYPFQQNAFGGDGLGFHADADSPGNQTHGPFHGQGQTVAL